MTKSKSMHDHVSELADKIAPHVESARDRAVPVLADARGKAGPIVTEARDLATPVLTDVKDKLTHEVLPVITAALAAAGEATEEVRTEAKRRGAATAAALKGEIEPPRKTHRLRRFLVVLGLGGVIAFVAKKLSDREATTAWQSSYQPEPSPSPSASTQTTTATPPADETPTATAAAAATSGVTLTDDEGAAGPDEAVADAGEMPHAATTPDHPAEEIHLKQDGPDVP